jgi:hypothetical protein
MRKRNLRLLALIIVLTLILSTTAFATLKASAYIAATNTWISRDGDTVTVNFYVVGTNIMDMIGVKKIYLYEKTGNTWYLVETYDYTDTNYAAEMMGYNSGFKSGGVDYSGSASKCYYADVRFYAERAGGSDTIPQNTPISCGSGS